MQILLYNVFCIVQYETSEPMTTDVILEEKNHSQPLQPHCEKFNSKRMFDFLKVYIV